MCGPSLRVAELDGTSRSLVDGDEQVSWGSAEFVASEEMDRARGYWWAPDGESLAVTRVDTTPVTRWWIADPSHPDSVPTSMPYPAAGTDNAFVTLHLLRLDGKKGGANHRVSRFCHCPHGTPQPQALSEPPTPPSPE